MTAAHGRFSHICQMYMLYTERQKWLPWQRPLVAGYRQYLHFLAGPVTTQTTLHNQLPNHYRSHKASYSNFSHKIGCHGNNP